MFKCKACIAKDQHIQDLRSQIADFRGLVIPPPAQTPPDNVIEADAMLSGHQDRIDSELDSEAVSIAEEIQLERERILSGSY